MNDFVDGLSVLDEIRPVTYRYNGKAGTPLDPDGTKRIGVIAQEVEKVAAYCVYRYISPENPGDELKQEFYGVENDPLIFVLINSCKQLKSDVTGLKSQVDALTVRLTKAECELQTLRHIP